ncbi:MAG: class I tRNA ligase family protein, partial [Candidatus Diapherotrites archaeon]|nr:class I tRNA ligase family protein [Candidatus Diapherotrites archaeon]
MGKKKGGSKTDFRELEQKWQDYWWDNDTFQLWDPNDFEKKPFAIDTPPRYTSGPMHMGHSHHYSQIDFMGRYKRMRGFNVNFAAGWDCNGMPIEVNVEKERKVKMREVPREQFIEWCSEFASRNMKTMTSQYKMLGNSANWKTPYRTCSKEYRSVTQYSFLKALEEDRVYRGEHPVNWCTRCATAIADAEVEYEERNTKLNYLKFAGDDGKEYIIATTRPEFLPACVAVFVHPKDEKNAHLVGKKMKVPLFDFSVPVLTSKDVDPEFGSGIVMVCTFGDKDDLVKVYENKLT